MKAYVIAIETNFFPVTLNPKNFTFFSSLEKEINIVSNKTKHHNFEIHNGKLKLITFKIVELIKNKLKYLALEEQFSIFLAIGAHAKITNKKFAIFPIDLNIS